MQELARIAPRTCLESFWTSEYLPETSYRCPEAFSASLRNIPGMPQEPPARSQDAPEIQKMISESLRARPQDPSGTVFNNFCKLFVSQPSFHGFRSFFWRFVKARNLRIVWQCLYIQQFGHVSNFRGVWPRKCRKFVEILKKSTKRQPETAPETHQRGKKTETCPSLAGNCRNNTHKARPEWQAVAKMFQKRAP